MTQVRLSQLPLPFTDRDLSPSTRKTSFCDPTFGINKNLPIHRWVPWIAGFSSEFVKDVLRRYLNAPGAVLDPFSGVGTTLIEAVIHGHNAIGFEINPYAALACRVKANAWTVDINQLQDAIRTFRLFFKDKTASAYTPRATPPATFKTRSPFYSPRVLRKVLIFQDFIAEVDNHAIRDMFRLAFAATMVTYSNYSYEPSLGRRASAGKADIEDFEVGISIAEKLTEMKNDCAFFQSCLTNPAVQARVINDSFFNCEKLIPENSVDLIVTSPPYLNNYHYNRNTRPHLHWLGLVTQSQDMKRLEESNFGKYWQTVRELESTPVTFPTCDSDLLEQLNALRELNPEKGIYGGRGWANYAISYFNDCHKFAVGVQHVLKPGGTALIVIGNSILQGLMIPTDRYLARIAETVGLELIGIEIPRATRVGNSIIKSKVRVAKAQDSHQLYEAIVELRKPG